MRRSLIDPQKSYTFSDYFQRNIPVDELATYFGYRHDVQLYQLPKKAVDTVYFASLHQGIAEFLLYVDLSSESARRETLIAPVLLNSRPFIERKSYGDTPSNPNWHHRHRRYGRTPCP